MQTKTLLVTVAATVVLWAGAGGAAVVPIVGFTNLQLTATAINLRGATNYGNYGGGPALDERYIAEYSDTEPLLANGANYSGVNIYGGRVRTQFDTTNSIFGVLNNAVNTAGLNFRTRSNSNTTFQIASLFYVKKDDFVNNGNTMPVNITSDSKFTLVLGNEQYGGGYLRCVVRIGNQLYVSEASQNLTYSGGTGSSNIYNFTGLDSSNWAPYDPAANIYFDADSATFESLTETNIQAAGFVMYLGPASPFAATNHWKVYQFDITADVVPEPGLGLMVAGVALLAMARRRGRE